MNPRGPRAHEADSKVDVDIDQDDRSFVKQVMNELDAMQRHGIALFYGGLKLWNMMRSHRK